MKYEKAQQDRPYLENHPKVMPFVRKIIALAGAEGLTIKEFNIAVQEARKMLNAWQGEKLVSEIKK